MEESRLTELAENTRRTIWSSNKHSLSSYSLPGTVTKIEDNSSVICGSTQERLFPVWILRQWYSLSWKPVNIPFVNQVPTDHIRYCKKWVFFSPLQKRVKSNSMFVWDDNSRSFFPVFIFYPTLFLFSHCFKNGSNLRLTFLMMTHKWFLLVLITPLSISHA